MNQIKEKYLQEKLTQIEIQTTKKDKLKELNHIINENNRTIHHWINTAIFTLLFIGLIILQLQGVYHRDNLVITPEGDITTINHNNVEYLNITYQNWKNLTLQEQKKITDKLK